MIRKWLDWRVIGTLGGEWRFLPLILLPQLIPPYAWRGYAWQDWGMVNAYILTHAIKGNFSAIYPIFQILPLVLLAGIFFAGKRMTRVFSVYVSLTYVGMAFLQNISTSEKYGFAVCTANVVTFLMLAGLWLWEAVAPKNRFEPRQQPAWSYWPILLALLPLWEPVNPATLLPDFNPVYMLTSGAGLSFCLATPLYLAILGLYFPQVNKPLFAATALIGLVIALGNLAIEFVLYPGYWWVGVLHLPLLIISAYSLGKGISVISDL